MLRYISVQKGKRCIVLSRVYLACADTNAQAEMKSNAELGETEDDQKRGACFESLSRPLNKRMSRESVRWWS